jgi:hypothetical protein
MSYDEQRISDQIYGGLNKENNFFEELKGSFQSISQEEMKAIWNKSNNCDKVGITFKEWEEGQNIKYRIMDGIWQDGVVANVKKDGLFTTSEIINKESK